MKSYNVDVSRFTDLHEIDKTKELTGYFGQPSAIFKLKAVTKIPKYASKSSFTIIHVSGDEEYTICDVHFIVREYKKHVGEVYYYGYYLKEEV